MRHYFQRARTTLCALAAALGTVQPAVSAVMPQFAGTYQLTDVVDNGAQVHFTVKFTLLNPGNTDIKGGILVMMDSQPHSTLVDKVATITLLPHLGQTDVTGILTVSSAEFARWQHGRQPRFDFLVPSAQGAMEVTVQARPAVDAALKAN